MKSTLKLVSWNVNGIRACGKKGLPEFIAEEEPDILCLQETKANREQVEPDLQTLGYDFADWSSAVRKGYSGVATFSIPKPLQVVKGTGNTLYDSEGRFVITSYPQFDLYNIYFPNGGSGDTRHHFKQEFLRDLNVHLAKELAVGKKIVVVGDYNVAHLECDVHDPKRLSKESGFLPEERQWLTSFIELGFVDTFRHFHPEAKERYSWWSYRELARVNNRGWRIDYICISKNLLPHLKSADILDQVTGSDHCPVVAEFKF
jgi:exodeoxyribonuclease-3